jgi:hypothetical protein
MFWGTISDEVKHDRGCILYSDLRSQKDHHPMGGVMHPARYPCFLAGFTGYGLGTY